MGQICINSKAKTRGVFQTNRRVGEGIAESESGVSYPTFKNPLGEVFYKRPSDYSRAGADFLLFKAALYDFTRKYKKQRK